MTITQLQYVLAVARHRHFGRAAIDCHITQPTLSMQLSKLEQELGVIIFDRSKNPIVTTDVGEKIIEQAKVAISEFNKIHHIVTELDGVVEGSLHLAIIPTLMPYLAPKFLGNFAKKYPKVELHVEERTTAEIIDLLLRDQIDCAILVTPLGHDQIIERSLFYEDFYLYVNKNHGLLKKEKVSQNDLDIDDVWLLNEGHCFRDQAIQLCRSKGTKSKTGISFESGGLDTLKRMVDTVGGYTFIPALAAQDIEKTKDGKYLKEFKGQKPTREVSIVSARSFLKENIIDALEEVILEGLPDGIYGHKTTTQKIIPLS